MAKETEKRLIKTLEFLQEPHGSTIPTIVKAMNGGGPEVSLKKIVQTLRGCLKNGTLKLSEGRVKVKQLDLVDSEEKIQLLDSCGITNKGCSNFGCGSKPNCPTKTCKPKCMKSKNLKLPNPCCLNNNDSFNDYISSSKICVVDGEPPEGGGDGGNGDPEAGKCKKKKPRCRKPKPKCKKKKPKCPKPKPKCPKPKPKCPKPKPKCPKPKPKCPKPKPKCPKKCGRRHIQPYCKKNRSDF